MTKLKNTNTLRVRAKSRCVSVDWEDLNSDYECRRSCEGLAVNCVFVVSDQGYNNALLDYGLAFLGMVYYNHSKLQALKAKEVQRRWIRPQTRRRRGGKLLTEREGTKIGMGKK